MTDHQELIAEVRAWIANALREPQYDYRAVPAEFLERLVAALASVPASLPAPRECKHNWLPPTVHGGNDVCEFCGAIGGRWVPASAARPEGPYKADGDDSGQWWTMKPPDNYVWGGPFTEAEALAVCDALNRVAAEERSPQPERDRNG